MKRSKASTDGAKRIDSSMDDFLPQDICEQTRSANRWPIPLSSGAFLTFDRSGTGPAGGRAGRAPSLAASSDPFAMPASDT